MIPMSTGIVDLFALPLPCGHPCTVAIKPTLHHNIILLRVLDKTSFIRVKFEHYFPFECLCGKTQDSQATKISWGGTQRGEKREIWMHDVY